VHFLRNALDHLPRKADDDCLQELRWLYDRRSIDEARRDLSAWIAKWGARYPKLVAWIEENIEETLTFYRLPLQHHKHLKSTDEIDKRILRRRVIYRARERPRGEARRVGCKRRQASYSFLAGLRRSRACPFGRRVLQRSTKRA
jgi:transposase-like protein